MSPPASQFNTSAKGILAVSFPICAGIFVQFIVAFIDNYFTAQIDGNAMSAVSFAGLLYITLIMASTGLSNAAQIRIATHLGNGERDRIHQTLGNTLKLAVALGVIQWAIYFFVLPIMMGNLLESEAIADQMTTFMQYRSFGFLVYTPLLSLQSLWSGIGRTRVLAISSTLLALSTAGLDYLLIFGYEIIPALGIKGAALATVAAEIIAFVFLLTYTRRNSVEHTGISARLNLSEKTESRSLLKLGIPIALQQMLSLSIWVIFYGMIESMGERELQSSFIVRNMYMLCYVSVGGFSTAAKTYVAGLIAEKRIENIYRLILKIGGLNFVCIAILTHPLWLYPYTVAGFFSKDREVIEMTVQTMYVVLPPMWLFAFTSIGLAAVEGSGKAVVGFLIELLTSVFYIIAAWLMVYSWSWPIHMVWLSDYIYFAFLGLFSLAYLATGRWRNQELSY